MSRSDGGGYCRDCSVSSSKCGVFGQTRPTIKITHISKASTTARKSNGFEQLPYSSYRTLSRAYARCSRHPAVVPAKRLCHNKKIIPKIVILAEAGIQKLLIMLDSPVSGTGQAHRRASLARNDKKVIATHSRRRGTKPFFTGFLLSQE